MFSSVLTAEGTMFKSKTRWNGTQKEKDCFFRRMFFFFFSLT